MFTLFFNWGKVIIIIVNQYKNDRDLYRNFMEREAAIAHGLILVSNDSDLLRVQGINLENWVLISEI